MTARVPAMSQCAPTAEHAAANRGTASDAAVPERSWRILGGFEIYNAVRLFDPHAGLIAGQNWDSVFTAILPTIADAAAGPAYLGAVSRFSAALNDGHAVKAAFAFAAAVWIGYPPIIVRRIERSSGRQRQFRFRAAPGVRRGDILFSVDGVDAAARFADVRQYVSGSNRHRATRARQSCFSAAPRVRRLHSSSATCAAGATRSACHAARGTSRPSSIPRRAAAASDCRATWGMSI